MMYLVNKDTFTVAQVSAMPINNTTVRVAGKERWKNTLSCYYADTMEEAMATIKELKREKLKEIQKQIERYERLLSLLKSHFEDLKNSI